MTKQFTPFDPLEAKQTTNADVAINAAYSGDTDPPTGY